MMEAGWRASVGGSDERVGLDGTQSAGMTSEIRVILNGAWRVQDRNLLDLCKVGELRN